LAATDLALAWATRLTWGRLRGGAIDVFGTRMPCRRWTAFYRVFEIHVRISR
jgi:hypothetical protein